MTNKEIKNAMKKWFEAYKDRDDTSYFELWNALRTMKSAGLITHKQWNMVYDYDRELMEEI